MSTPLFEIPNPMALLLVPILVLLLYLAWRDNALPALRSRLTLVCRATICPLLVLALAGLTVQQPVDREAVVFVADLSASTEQARTTEQDFISQAIAAKRPDDAYAVVGTARQAVVERVLGTSGRFDAFNSNTPNDGTDLAAGLRLAGGLLPAGYRTRVVLLSDGQQTTGDATGQARLLAARGVRVDVVPLAVSTGPEVLLDQLVAPRATHEGEKFSIRVPVVSNVQTMATVRLYRGDDLIGEQTIETKPGITDVTFSTQADQSGFVDLRATLSAAADTLDENNQVAAVVQVQGPPRVLVIAGRDGEETAIVNALTSGGMHVETQSPAAVPSQAEGLGAYAAVVLSDVSASSLDDAQQSALRSYVRDLGRGLLAIGGDTSFGQGDYVGTPLDDVLPVRSSARARWLMTRSRRAPASWTWPARRQSCPCSSCRRATWWASSPSTRSSTGSSRWPPSRPWVWARSRSASARSAPMAAPISSARSTLATTPRNELTRSTAT